MLRFLKYSALLISLILSLKIIARPWPVNDCVYSSISSCSLIFIAWYKKQTHPKSTINISASSFLVIQLYDFKFPRFDFSLRASALLDPLSLCCLRHITAVQSYEWIIWNMPHTHTCSWTLKAAVLKLSRRYHGGKWVSSPVVVFDVLFLEICGCRAQKWTPLYFTAHYLYGNKIYTFTMSSVFWSAAQSESINQDCQELDALISFLCGW